MNQISSLKELRKNAKITQIEAAKIVGMPIRTYKDYENLPEREGTLKYKAIMALLNEYVLLDEEHGILDLETIRKTVSDVLKKYQVKSCYLFGSYAKGEARNNSDVDLVIDTEVTGLSFFGLIEDLRENLHKRVDLLDLNQLVNNKELISEVLKTGIKIYG